MDDQDTIRRRPDGPDQNGESGGGAYPNPHTDKRDPDFKGGESDRRYHGVAEDDEPNENAVSKED
jgi:hypothetical protein